MKLPLTSLGFPLLVKELTESAARRRTYVVRVGYALLLFIGALLFFWEQVFSRNMSPLSMLGQGQNMFLMIVALQFAGIYLFLPAMTCTALTSEKERNTLALLLLTRLGPWTIIFEKLFGRLVPMFTFMLLALPLMAFAYSYGGVQSQQIWGAIWLLGLTSIQVGAFCLMCSAYCRTTVGAFVSANLIYLIFLVTIPGLAADVAGIPEQRLMFFVGPVVYFEIFDWGAGGNVWGQLTVRSIPLVGSVILFLVMARFNLVRRAFAQPRHLLRRIFQGLDKIFWKINDNRLTRGVVLVGENSTLPEDKPVQWREIAKKNLSQFRYLVRIFLVLEMPIALMCVGVLTMGGGRTNVQVMELSALLFLLWIITALILTVQASSLITSERSRQTLDVLLATPLSGREIVLQKMRGLQRLMWVLGACFLTIFVTEIWWYGSAGITPTNSFSPRFTSYYDESFLHYYSPARYFVASLLSVLIYLPMIAWLAMWVGLKVKTPARAILGSLALLISWCVLTLLVVVNSFGGAISPTLNEELIAFVSPMAIIIMNEFNAFGHNEGLFPGVERGHLFRWIVVLGNFAFYGLILYLIRASCLRHADRYLGRREDQSADVPRAIVTSHEPVELEPATTS